MRWLPDGIGRRRSVQEQQRPRCRPALSRPFNGASERPSGPVEADDYRRIVSYLTDELVRLGHEVTLLRDEVGVGDRPALVIGDRHQRHLAEAEIERLEVGKILPTVKSRHRPIGHLAKRREMKLVDMEM
jgi:hypothetical protein